jgi:hypothetical protein
VTSPEKRSGKTRLLEALELVVREPMATANISDAALFRAIGELAPTLLFDEIDAVFGPKARDREDLRGMINAGHRRGAVVRRMGGAKMTTLEAFPVYSCKAFAGIGDCLPDTVRDRSIVVRLQRRTRSEPVERFRRRDVEAEANELRERFTAWAEAAIPELRQARPALPEQLDDRAQDAWEPLLAIADMAGGSWPERARHAAIVLSGGEQRDDDSLGVRLLHDLQRIYHPAPTREDDPPPEPLEKLATATLLAALNADEEAPWASYGRGDKPLTATQLAGLLRPFDIRSSTHRFEGDERAKGYLREQFVKAWERYVTPVTASQPLRRDNPHGYAENGPSDAVTRHGSESGANPHEYSVVTAARLETGERRDSGQEQAAPRPTEGVVHAAGGASNADEDGVSDGDGEGGNGHPDGDELERLADLIRARESAAVDAPVAQTVFGEPGDGADPFERDEETAVHSVVWCRSCESDKPYVARLGLAYPRCGHRPLHVPGGAEGEAAEAPV